MRRRDFITFLGCTAATWPIAVRAQQPAIPVIGFLSSQSPGAFADLLRGFHQGLKETGYIAGENVAVEDRVGRQSNRSTVGACGRTGSPTGRSDRRERTDPLQRPQSKRLQRFPSSSRIPQTPSSLVFVASLARPTGNAHGAADADGPGTAVQRIRRPVSQAPGSQ